MFHALMQPNVASWLMPTFLIGFSLLAVGFVVTFLTVRRMDKRLKAFLRGPDGASLEQMLAHQACEIERVEQRIEAVEQAVGVLQAQMPTCFQKHGLVRYNAFENVGGEQSFSLAVLDGHNNGYVLTSVYSRAEVRVYAKRVQNGRASHPLSDEETRALQEALTL
ncbi:MAG TPA: DUF4446 family protein [Chthonomonas sp.]|uniref:DUF4446 family protein n=1 Tax=Chthonomonas sp. TaxID=2282153 RepID=UPI002B4AC0F1|nr:DUF4446 family protein [Chthonomonas sp.]HLH79736.1 DUF4446 family protein [Chthonomonas sp.]